MFGIYLVMMCINVFSGVIVKGLVIFNFNGVSVGFVLGNNICFD